MAPLPRNYTDIGDFPGLVTNADGPEIPTGAADVLSALTGDTVNGAAATTGTVTRAYAEAEKMGLVAGEVSFAVNGAQVYAYRAHGPMVPEQGLRFDANLGILEQEKTAPQPIQVDAELNLGTQPLLPTDDDIHHVLDYRKVRQIIINECTAEHVNLLESLIGKLANRLMQLPGVLGVRVKIAKLEIFDDCEVAIRMETGQW